MTWAGNVGQISDPNHSQVTVITTALFFSSVQDAQDNTVYAALTYDTKPSAVGKTKYRYGNGCGPPSIPTSRTISVEQPDVVEFIQPSSAELWFTYDNVEYHEHFRPVGGNSRRFNTMIWTV